MIKADTTDRYYRVPMDDRDLNYNKYFDEGEADITNIQDYTSHNTRRMDVTEVKELLLTLEYIRNEINA